MIWLLLLTTFVSGFAIGAALVCWVEAECGSCRRRVMPDRR